MLHKSSYKSGSFHRSIIWQILSLSLYLCSPFKNANAISAISFDTLKKALCSAPVLALPDFSKGFVVETEACSYGIGVVLMQDDHPLAYISRRQQLNLSIYEKELLADLFIIKTDQKSLKYLLEQRLNTLVQQQWLPKLLKFDCDIQYKEGDENLVADALSRLEDYEILNMTLSTFDSDLLTMLQQ